MEKTMDIINKDSMIKDSPTSIGQDDEGFDDVPEELIDVPAKTNEPIPSQEIVMIELDGIKLQLGSQVLTPKALTPLALGIFDHIIKKRPDKKNGGSSYVG